MQLSAGLVFRHYDSKHLLIPCLGGPAPSASSATPRRCCALARSTRDCAAAVDRRRAAACENGIALALRPAGQVLQVLAPSASAADVAACSAGSQLPAGQIWHELHLIMRDKISSQSTTWQLAAAACLPYAAIRSIVLRYLDTYQASAVGWPARWGYKRTAGRNAKHMFGKPSAGIRVT